MALCIKFHNYTIAVAYHPSIIPHFFDYAPYTFFVLIFLKLFFKFNLIILPSLFKNVALSRFLSFFINTPVGNFKKSTTVQFFIKLKTNFFFFKNRIFIKFYNFFKIIKFPKYIVWRPLFKKISYYGLYVHARTNFLKFFKN